MRPIDADLINKENTPWLDGICLVIAKAAVDDAPTLDVMPIIHAHWTWREGILKERACYCSHCGAELPSVLVGSCTVDNPYPEVEYIEETRYCPNCGAKMEEEDQNEKGV